MTGLCRGLRQHHKRANSGNLYRSDIRKESSCDMRHICKRRVRRCHGVSEASQHAHRHTLLLFFQGYRSNHCNMCLQSCLLEGRRRSRPNRLSTHAGTASLLKTRPSQALLVSSPDGIQHVTLPADTCQSVLCLQDVAAGTLSTCFESV